MKLLTPFNCNSVRPGTSCEKLEAESPHSRDWAPGGCLSAWPAPLPFLSPPLSLPPPPLHPCSPFLSNFYRNLSLLPHSSASSGVSLMAKLQPLPPVPQEDPPTWRSSSHLSEYPRRTVLLQVAEDGKALGSPGTLFQSQVGCFMTT